MKIIKYILTFICISVLFFSVQAEEFVVNGVYQGKNIYVQNPLADDQKSFCTKAVYLNDLLVVNNPKTSAYEIDLSGLKIDDQLNIKIIHSGGCRPKIINPQVIRPKNQFQFISVYVDENHVRWFTQGEKGPGKFMIEQYLNNKWVFINTVNSEGSYENNQYQVEASHQIGRNRYRIKYIIGGDHFYSKVHEYFSEEDPITFYPTRVTDKIILSRETSYEVLDAAGNSVVQGTGSEIHVEDLNSGLYYLNINNKTEKFIKK